MIDMISDDYDDMDYVAVRLLVPQTYIYQESLLCNFGQVEAALRGDLTLAGYLSVESPLW